MFGDSESVKIDDFSQDHDLCLGSIGSQFSQEMGLDQRS